MEMEFAQWYLIRILSEFYDEQQLLPDTLAALYRDKEYLTNIMVNNQANMEDPIKDVSNNRKVQEENAIGYSVRWNKQEMEMDKRREEEEAEIWMNEIQSRILKRPVFLDQEQNNESGKYIRSIFPECRIEFKGFGRFLGYSDLDQILFWTPFLILRYFYLQYRSKGDEILAILTTMSGNAGLVHAKREITIDNQRELAKESVRTIMKKYAA